MVPLVATIHHGGPNDLEEGDFWGDGGPSRCWTPKNGEITRPIGFIILNSNTCGGINAGIAVQGAAPLRNC